MVVAVNRGEDVHVFFGLIQHFAVIDQWRFVLTVGKNIAGARVLLRPHAVDILRVRDLDDLVAFHDVAANTGDARVGFVVGEDVAPVIGAVGKRHMRVVQIAVVIGLLAAFAPPA